MQCGGCAGEQVVKAGRDRQGQQRYRCAACGQRQATRSASAFCGYRFPDAIIALAVRWYLRFRLSYADVAELLAERGIHVDPSTLFDWVQQVTPLYYKEAARAHRHPVGGRWLVDETDIKVAGVWCYAYRASDEHDQVSDVDVSTTRDQEAATAFFRHAIGETDVTPHLVTTDKAAAYPPALQAVLPRWRHERGKSAQQRIERDHQHLKGRLRPMRGFKQQGCAQAVCSRHGFIRNLGQGFYRLGIVMGDPQIPRPPRLVQAWNELTTMLQAV